MRHGDKINNLGRKAAHRKALLSNLACQLFEHKHIITTLAKARALRIYAEPLVTRAKTDSTHNRRTVFSYLQDKEAVTELFTNISEKVGDRPGGYTRIIKMPKRMGDAADMALIELVDYNETYTKDGESAAKKTRRSRRGSGSNAGTSTGRSAGTAAAATGAATADMSADNNDTAAAEEAATQDIAADNTEAAVEPTPAAMDESPATEDATPVEKQEKGEEAEGAGA